MDFDFELKQVAKDDFSILFEGTLNLIIDVDVLVPCAIGGILNKDTIPKIKAKIVCGSANNQLREFIYDDKLLQNRNILYMPDVPIFNKKFLVNRMGVVHSADEVIIIT